MASLRKNAVYFFYIIQTDLLNIYITEYSIYVQVQHNMFKVIFIRFCVVGYVTCAETGSYNRHMERSNYI